MHFRSRNQYALVLAVVSSCLLCSVKAQRAPPGVNPQVYQQQQMTPQQAQQMAMQQQQQAAAMHHQQQQQQQQQRVPQQQAIPQQQHTVPQRQGQPPPPPPPAQGHPQQMQPQGHHPPPPPQGQNQQLLQAQHMNQERDHIREHVGVPVDTSNMSEQELQFHYFKMHDADNNNKLDGCELVKSLIHWHDEANHDPQSGQPIPEPKIFTNEELISMIDPILDQDDRNRDGFIDYPEFIQAQQAAARAA